MRALMALIDGQRGSLFGWVPVLIGCGIAVYFSLPAEPSDEVVMWVAAGCVVAALGALVVPASARFFAFAVMLLLGGFAVAAVRAHSVGAPVLEFRYYGPIEGRIVMVDRSASDAVRLTLDKVVLSRVAPAKTPERVRISLHGEQGFLDPEPGQIVGMTGHLSPPSGPTEPGGYDFQRQAWFQRLGAVGYTRTPALEIGAPEVTGFWLHVTRVRLGLSAWVQSRVPGSAGAFAAAVTTGDRSGMNAETLEALRAANLAHLLAISGLHMGLLTGFVFATARLVLLLVPGVGLHWPVKKIAAVVALIFGVAYLLLSGGNVATERAFIMVTVMFVAVLIGRRAITLRAVAVAAIIVLILRPETLMGPGFQMSFAATLALVAVFGWLRERDWSQNRWPRWARYVGGVALSSLIAGAATAPFGAVHFNQVPHYGLAANMVAVPLMGLVVIPGAVMTALLTPLGLAEVGLAAMALAISGILWTARTVSSWPGAVSLVVSPGGLVLPLIGLGGLFLALWSGRARILGFMPLAVALALWFGAERPDILVSDSGGLVGVLGEDGRALSKERGDGFSAESWLENDGDGVTQEMAFGRWEAGGERLRRIEIQGYALIHATGKVAGAQAVEMCRSADIVILNVELTGPDGCNVYDLKRLRGTGSLAIDVGPEGAVVADARARQGTRLWSQ